MKKNTVTVYTLARGKDHQEGTLTWNGRRIEIEPDSQLMRNMRDDPINLPDGSRLTKADGLRFLRGLCRVYVSAYLRATSNDRSRRQAGRRSRTV
jgi:hypothetical protein